MDKKGNFSSRKHITLLTKSIEVFMRDYYLNYLEKHTYHRLHFILLGKYEKIKERNEALKPRNIDIYRNYANKCTFTFTLEL